MHPILRLSIPCGRGGHQSAELAPASRPQRHAAGHLPYSGERYRAGKRISTGFGGIPGQSGDQQALLHTPADAVTPTRGACPMTDPHARVQWRLGGDIRGVVSRVPCLPPANGSVPPRIKRSPVQTESGDVPPTGGDECGSGVGASPRTWAVWGLMAGAEVDTVGRIGCPAWRLPPLGRFQSGAHLSGVRKRLWTNCSRLSTIIAIRPYDAPC
jgi:hypothetical protein